MSRKSCGGFSFFPDPPIPRQTAIIESYPSPAADRTVCPLPTGPALHGMMARLNFRHDVSSCGMATTKLASLVRIVQFRIRRARNTRTTDGIECSTVSSCGLFDGFLREKPFSNLQGGFLLSDFATEQSFSRKSRFLFFSNENPGF